MAGPQQADAAPGRLWRAGPGRGMPSSRFGAEAGGQSAPASGPTRAGGGGQADYSTGAESRTLPPATAPESRPATCCRGSGGLRRGGRPRGDPGAGRDGRGGAGRRRRPRQRHHLNRAGGEACGRAAGGCGPRRIPALSAASAWLPAASGAPRPSRGRNTLTGSGASEGRKRRRGRGGGGGGPSRGGAGWSCPAAPQPPASWAASPRAIPRLCLRTSAPSVARLSITDKHHFLTL